MNRKKTMKVTIIMVLFVALIIGYYVYLSSNNTIEKSNGNLEKKTEKEMTAVEQLLARAKYKEYPATPVQVVKYYNEITSCYYNETYSDDQLEELAKLTLDLFDEELAANQEGTSYIESLRRDIADFKSNNITIYDDQVTSATDVEYFEHNGYECAKLYCTYTLKSGTSYQPSKEVFILRKDNDGHWKIFGFELVKE